MKKGAFTFFGLFAIALSGVFYFPSTESMAAGKASVKVTSAKSKTGTTLTFQTVPGDGLKINAEGPWKLEIKSATGVKTSATEYKRPEWKESIAGFEVPATIEGGAKSAEISFKLVSFVCTQDKTICYREVVEDKTKVTL